MNAKQNRTPDEQPNFNKDKDRAVAAGIGAVIGGAAFATAAYTSSAEEEPEEELVVHVEQPVEEEPHTVELDTNEPLTSASEENENIVIEYVELPDEANDLCTDMQQMMDLTWIAPQVEESIETSTTDHSYFENDDSFMI